MNLSMGISLSCSIRQELRLTQAQRQEIECRMSQLRLGLVGSLRDEQYEIRGCCPSCGHKMTPAEVLAGFTDNPTDFTTCCVECDYRYQPRLIAFTMGATIELPFFCGPQTTQQMAQLGHLSPEELSTKHPAVYRAAITHYGSLVKAFEMIGISYPFTEQFDWTAKVGPYLGRLSDGVIATAVGVPKKEITKLRKRLQITAASKRKMAKELN